VIGDAGLIFEEGSVEDLCRKLESLMKNGQVRSRLASAGRERVLRKYTHQEIAQEMLKVFRELIALGQSIAEEEWVEVDESEPRP
ncbi:hypothetical protein HKBW3C_03171, partial [Candidatus Hakubella thermalkaliphila]